MTSFIQNIQNKSNREKKRFAWIVAGSVTVILLLFFVFYQYPSQMNDTSEMDNSELEKLRDTLAEVDMNFKQNAEELSKYQSQINKQNRDILRDQEFIAEQIASMDGRVLSLGRIQDGVKLSIDGIISNEQDQEVQLIFILENQGTEQTLRFPALTKSTLFSGDSEITPTGYSGKTEEYVNTSLEPGDIYSGSLIFPWFDMNQNGHFTAIVEIGDDRTSEFSFEWPAAEDN
ncbi:hypothetical protein ACFL1U_02335 [Patescibacteria group bacterium]